MLMQGCHMSGKTKFSSDQGKVREFWPYQIAICEGNVTEKQNFLQVREKMSGNFSYLTHVREFCDDISGNFVMTLFLD